MIPSLCGYYFDIQKACGCVPAVITKCKSESLVYCLIVLTFISRSLMWIMKFDLVSSDRIFRVHPGAGASGARQTAGTIRDANIQTYYRLQCGYACRFVGACLPSHPETCAPDCG